MTERGLRSTDLVFRGVFALRAAMKAARMRPRACRTVKASRRATPERARRQGDTPPRWRPVAPLPRALSSKRSRLVQPAERPTTSCFARGLRCTKIEARQPSRRRDPMA